MSQLAYQHYPLRHRLFRALWIVCWTLLAAWTPPFLHAWRRLVLRLFGAEIGRDARVYASAKIWYPPNLIMAEGAVLGWQARIYCHAPVSIGRNAVVSQFAHLITGTHDIDGPDFPLVTRPIHIGANAWVAAGAMVGPGVRIGEGAVLAAGGVAFSDIPGWQVHIGNPARLLRMREPGATSPWPGVHHEMLLPPEHSRHR